MIFCPTDSPKKAVTLNRWNILPVQVKFVESIPIFIFIMYSFQLNMKFFRFFFVLILLLVLFPIFFYFIVEYFQISCTFLLFCIDFNSSFLSCMLTFVKHFCMWKTAICIKNIACLLLFGK